MTFDSAIKSLTNGLAAKLSTWSGYIFRTDITTGISAWAASTSYTVGTLVTYDGSTYICNTAHTSSTTFSSGMWTKTAKYTLTFRKRNNVSGSTTDDTVYTITPTIDAGTISYKFEPDGYDSSGSPSSTEEGQMLKLDGALLQAILSSDWITGSITTFESAREGSSHTW